MNLIAADLALVLAALAAFRFCRPAVAVLIVFLGGWVVLPVGPFPPGSASDAFPYWITGLAVPSDMLLTKAWLAPAAALLGVVAFDRAALRPWRPRWVDAPMLGWCLWPLVQAALGLDPRPPAVIASLYLAGSWGLPWLLGRLYFATVEGQLLLARGLAWAGLVCLPFSLIEGIWGPLAYDWVYEPHPFRLDGASRYIGFRPLGFFENGNQFGLWVSMCALAALWVARAAPSGPQARVPRIVAAVVVAMALAAQSVGGIVLLGLGSIFLWACARLRPRLMVAAVLALLMVSGAVYVSGLVPMVHIAKETALGRSVVDGFRSVGRGSFTWRIAQDQKLLPEAMARPVTGSAHWDWWRSQGSRPWALSVLVLGQFGLVGLCASLAALLWPAARVGWQAPRASGWKPLALPLMLATLVSLTVVDGLMNSFTFFPAILIAGGLADAALGARRARGEVTRIPSRRHS